MFDKIFQVVQSLDNSQGLKVLEQIIRSLSYVITVINSDELKGRKNELIDDLIAILQTHKDKTTQQQPTQETKNG